METKYFIN